MKIKWILTIGCFILILGLSLNFLDTSEQYTLTKQESLTLTKSHHKQSAKINGLSQSPNGSAQYFSNKRLAKGANRFPSENIVNAIRDKRQYFSQTKRLTAEPWVNLGPQNVGGRTRSFIFHPTNPEIIYSAGVSGGVWKSVDGGGDWVAVADDIENLAVVSLALFQSSPQTLLAGTGEGVYIGRPIVRSRGVEGNGIFKSTDDGVTWQAVSQTLNNPDFQFVNKIRTATDNTAFAATGKGIWRSDDFGDNWELVLDQSSRVGGCHEIEIRPASDPNQLLVSCGSFESAAVYKSNDNGDSWSSVIESANQGRTTIAFAPSNPARVYALSAQNQFGPYPYGVNGLYRSDDGGDNWTLISDYQANNVNNRALLATTNYVFDCGGSGVYQDGRLAGGGWYYNLITVDPTNENRIWTGGLDLWRSDDAGENFSLASFWWASEQQNSYIHGDHHSIVYHPNYDGVNETRMFASNDGGIWQTNNSTASLATDNCNPNTAQVSWQPLNNNYAVTQFYHGSVARDGQTMIGGSQDNGTIWRSETGEWQQINGGDGSYSAIDPNDPNLVYVSSQYANLVRINIQPSGNIRTSISEGITEPGLFITPFTLDQNDTSRLWLAGLALWRSDNRGDSWTKASSDEYSMNFIDGLSALAVAPGNSDLVIMGGTDGNIFRHTNALSGTASTNMSSLKIADGYISSVNFDSNDPTKVVATVSTFGQPHAWMSLDSGESWEALDEPGSAGLPDVPTHDIIVAPHDSNTLYVATDIGVYSSSDNGSTWFPLTTGMPNVAVEKLVYNRFNLQSDLIAFTYGRGTFKSRLTDIENYPPQVAGSSPSLTLEEGESASYSVVQHFTDQNGDPLSFSASNLPSGLSLSEAGLLSGSTNAIGTTNVSIIASDGELTATTQLALTIVEVSSSSSGGGSFSYWFLLFIFLLIAPRDIINRPVRILKSHKEII